VKLAKMIDGVNGTSVMAWWHSHVVVMLRARRPGSQSAYGTSNLRHFRRHRTKSAPLKEFRTDGTEAEVRLNLLGKQWRNWGGGAGGIRC